MFKVPTTDELHRQAIEKLSDEQRAELGSILRGRGPYGLNDYDRRRIRDILDTTLEPEERAGDPRVVDSTPIDNTKPAEQAAMELFASLMRSDAKLLRIEPLGTKGPLRLGAVGCDALGWLPFITDGRASERACDTFDTLADAELWCTSIMERKSQSERSRT